ncbi:unnamed protein product [Ascophyllum nodosum]
MPSPPASAPRRNARGFDLPHHDMTTRLYPYAPTVQALAQTRPKRSQDLNREGHLRALRSSNTKTAAVLDKTEFTKPHRDHVSAPVSGSIMSSSWMAPRMKLVRRASRDLSVDVQATTGQNMRVIRAYISYRLRHFQAGASKISAGGMARSNIILASKTRERQHAAGPGTTGLGNDHRADGGMDAQSSASVDNSIERACQGKFLQKFSSDNGRPGSPPHGGFIKSLQASPLWKDPFRNRYVFLYLKAETENPYRLSIVDSLGSSSDEFYTLSTNGLVFSNKDRTEFITIRDFEQQYMQYHRIAAIPFFKMYSQWKSLAKWKSFVRTRKRGKCRSVLEEDLFLLHPWLRVGIRKLKDACYELIARRALKVEFATQTLEQFCNAQEAHRKTLKVELQEFSRHVLDTVMKSCEDTLYNFLQSAGFNVKASTPEEAREFLTKTMQEVNPSEISFTERAAMRTQCRKLAKFLKVADFLVTDTYLDVALDSTRDLLREIQHAAESTSDEEVRTLTSIKENNNSCKRHDASASRYPSATERTGRQPLFVVELTYTEAIEDIATSSTHPWVDPSQFIRFNPPENEFHTRLEVVLFDSLAVVANHRRLLGEPCLRAYVSPILDQRGSFSDGQDLEAVIMEDSSFHKMLESLHQTVVQAFRRLRTYASSFDALTLCLLENAKFAKELNIDYSYANANVEQLKALLFNYDEQTERFKRIKTWQDVGVVRVASSKLEAILRPSPERCLEIVHRVVPQLYRINHETLLKELNESLEALSTKSKSVGDFANLTLQYRQAEHLTRGAKERAGEMQERYTFVASLYEVMKGNGVVIGDDTRTAANMIVKVREQLHAKIEMVESIYDEEHHRFSEELGKQAAQLAPRIQALKMDLGHGMIQNPAAEVTEVVDYLVACEKTLASLYTLADCLISWQTILQTGSFDRDELEEIESEMSHKTRLWRGIQTFEEQLEIWEKTPCEDLDYARMENDVARFWRIVQLSEKQLPTNPAVERLKNMVEEVKHSLPVVANLRSNTLTERHWEMLNDVLEIDVRANKGATFKQMMKANLKDVANQVNTIVTDAEQESILTQLLQKVQYTWTGMVFQLKPHQERKDMLIISSASDLTSRLDDSIMTVGNVLASPHVGPIRAEAEELSGKLLLLQTTLEECLIFQRTWGHFSSILAAPDIRKQLPKETRAFRVVDSFFKAFTKRTGEDPHCLVAGTVPGLIDEFKRNNEALEGIARSLEEFLQVKRQAFPRFYFLGDDELLELLSRSRDIAGVGPHLRKCFDAIYSLDFDDGSVSSTINAMVSREGERVALGPNLKARGALEDWLSSMEENMRKVLHRHIKVALAELEGMNFDGGLGRIRTKGPSRNMQHMADSRVEWALEGQPAQVVSTAVQISWTRATELALSREMRGESGAAQTWLQISIAGLHALVGRIQDKLTRLQRMLAVALVTAEVHNRDVLAVLVSQQVNDPQNFLWQAQLRFYWDMDTVKVHQSNAKMQYGFEYQGVAARLVITPLTERCWMTITGALDLKLGANPLGPAGTGKTESTKDLAKGLGVQCIVFNCSNQMDHSMPGRLFSGLAQTGAWACLDEFNRIDMEVLSVIAEQLMVLRNARLARVTELIFEGRRIPLKDHHVIVTMNPGYCGRSELPSNLQICFRPVAMMVPDHGLISEVILHSEGFEKAKELSTKVSTLSRLCSEQLSQQPHYDFGMRAVKSVLVFAGQMKRDYKCVTEKSEEDILIQALCSSNLPKLLDSDTLLFTSIMRDLFPPESLPVPSYDNLHRGVVAATRAMGLQTLKEQTSKIDQLHETLEVRFGVALVGPAGSGKSTLRRLLVEASTWLRDEELSQIAERDAMERGSTGGGASAHDGTAANTDSPRQDITSWMPASRGRSAESDAEEGGSELRANRESTTDWPQVKVSLLNPKALNVSELYGQYNPYTREWKDGVGSSLMRHAATADLKINTSHWIVFDGPIDALWIESMNTALDDNLMLCLASGERMRLRDDSMRLLFEVEDLLQASPATVSRLGVVYIPRGCTPPSSVFWTWLEIYYGYDALVDGAGFPSAKKTRDRLSELADLLMWPTLTYMAEREDRTFREEIFISQIQRVESFCALLQGLLARQRELYSRSTGWAMDPANVNVAFSTRAVRQGAIDSGDEPTEKGSSVLPVGGTNPSAPPLGVVDQTFFYSMVWGLGGSLTGDPALAFDVYVRDLVQMSGLSNSINLPATGTVFEYYVHFFAPGLGGLRPYEWRSWTVDVPSFEYTPDVPLYEIMVPTANTECYSFLLETNVGVGRPTFLAGASGSGKTVLAAHLFERRARQCLLTPKRLGSVEDPKLRGQSTISTICSTRRTAGAFDEDPILCVDWRSPDLLRLSVQPVLINMSAKTSSQGIQAALESKMVHVHKDLIGAPEGKINIIFVDDVNLPARDAFDSQPPLELLRQLVSEGGFYDRERLFWKTMLDTVMIVAAAPVGGARSPPSARFTRLFSVLCLPNQSTASSTTIFGSILRAFLAKDFLAAVAALWDSLVSATLDVYGKVTREILPTPSRPHYTFNLRDISKVVQGILLVKHHSVHAADIMVRLWIHEMSRVFGDRLADQAHRVMFEHMVMEATGRHFKLAGHGWQRDDLFDIKDPKPGEDYSHDERVLLFSDVLGTGSVASERFYEECPDLRRLVRQVVFYQNEYNLGGGDKEMSLVFLPDTVRHLLRIARILRQPRGNALVIGLAGSGKETLTQLAVSMAGSVFVRVSVAHNYGVRQFEEDLRRAALAAGTGAKDVIFLLKDSQILEETMLEDIDCFLGSGQLPSIFTADEEADIILHLRDAVRATGQPDTQARCMAFFMGRVRDRLHIVLALDPAKALFRERIRNFPNLVNYSTIDWYDAWPRNALHSVAHRILSPELTAIPTGPQSCGVGPRIAMSIIRSSVEVHEGVKPVAASFYAQLGRRIYISPKSYLDFLQTFLNMLHERQRALSKRLGSLNDGIVKLEETGRIVKGLKQELTELQPLLESKASQAEGFLAQVYQERKGAETIKDKVAKDEAVVAVRQEQISMLQQEAQKNLDLALPALEEAINALNSLKRDDISEVKSFQNPPQAVQTVMNAVCLLLSEDQQDWDSAKRVLSRSSFMDDLRNYKKEDMTPERRRSLKLYVKNENMSVDRLRQVSLAAAGMCMWVHAVDQYADTFEEVKPKMDTVQVLNQELKTANDILKSKRHEVDRIEEEVSLLMQRGHQATNEKEELQKEIDRCIQRLKRAETLMSGLKNENERWRATVREILDYEVNLTGDIFLSAAFVSYLGAFTGPFRHMLSASWAVILRDKGIHVSDGYSLAKVLGEPVVLRKWHLQGLPSDKTSVESALVATSVATGRWPFLIDPQRQACRWLKRHKEDEQDLASDGEDPSLTVTESSNISSPTMAGGLLCTNAGSPAILSILQSAIGEGRCLLIEDVGTTLDPVLEPVLCLRTFSKGGRTMLSLGDVEVEYQINFRLFLATELSNPLVPADTAIKVNIINFSVTKRGLEEQLLGKIVSLEQPELEERHYDLVASIATDQKQLLAIEDEILGLLNDAGSGVDILDDETLITTLSRSKGMSKAISERLADSKSTQRQIEENRESYRPVAVRGSLLYFTVAELCRVDSMYQYSLDYFELLFTKCIADSLDSRSGGLPVRLKLLLEKSTETVFRAVSRGLFERHKLLFAFLLCTGVLRDAGEVTSEEWMLFLRGARPSLRSILRRKLSRSRKGDETGNMGTSNPDSTVLDERSWQILQQAEGVVPSMRNICSSVANEWGRWKDWRSDTSAHRAPLPGAWEGKLNRFQKMIVVRALSQANVHGAVADFVEHYFGRDLVQFSSSGAAVAVEEVFSDVDEKSPCVFLLSRGADPVALLMKFASHLGMENSLEFLSLGKGQGPRAEEIIKVARANGSWVMLQNCHLACSWLPTLDRIVKNLGCSPGHSKSSFRLFLSVAPVNYFPVGVLQRSVKVADEPPRGIRANLRRSYNMQMSSMLKQEQQQGIHRPREWKRLVFGLCFFHAVVQERFKFGPLGWNVPYDFGDSDLGTAFQLLARFIDDLDSVSSTTSPAALPVDSLVYVTGNITYGGRVTDEWDRRCLLAVLDHFYCASIFGDSVCIGAPTGLSPRGSAEDQGVPSKAKARLRRRLSASSAIIAAAPVDAPPESYLDYIRQIPPEDGPEMFGMHASADISLRLKESNELLEAIFALQVRDASSPTGQRPDDVVLAVTQELHAKTPGTLKHRQHGAATNHLTRKGSTVGQRGRYEDSLNTVLIQELDNCNSLLEIVRNTVEQLASAVKGEVVMSPELEKVYNNFLINQVPQDWRRRGFASLKPLGSWMKDLRWRVRFFGLWLEHGNPYAFSLPAFFFPQGFLTAVLQKYARKHGVPVNLLRFKHEFPDIEQPQDLTSHPADGVMVYGMHIEGASWDHVTKRLCDPRHDQIRARAPMLHLLPETDHHTNSEDYVCPTYKTSGRRGELSTTGVSTNFVMAVEFPSNIPARQFILHGTAMLLSTES